MTIRSMREDEWSTVAELIYVSTNAYYTSHGMNAIFQGEPEETTRLFCEVYEALDPGCCLVAEDSETGQLMGSCFYHPRETHYALGIMNVHPYHFGKRVGRQLLTEITSRADAENKPTRLVSSALNLDSFSLYSKAGFTPRATFQDTLLTVPPEGVSLVETHSGLIRKATLDDVAGIVSLEEAVVGIRREGDWRYFMQNDLGIWTVWVSLTSEGTVDGVLAAVSHPGSRIVGPGVMRAERTVIALTQAILKTLAGQTALMLIPALSRDLLDAVYSWGGRNCEIHFAQCRGHFTPYDGVVIPTFMPETG